MIDLDRSSLAVDAWGHERPTATALAEISAIQRARPARRRSRYRGWSGLDRDAALRFSVMPSR